MEGDGGRQRYDAASLRELIERVAAGDVGTDDALTALRVLPFAAIADARVDHHRELRTGVPEVVFGQGKSRDQIERIMRELHARAGFALATRVAADDGIALASALPDAAFDAVGRVLRCGALARSGVRVAVVARRAQESVSGRV